MAIYRLQVTAVSRKTGRSAPAAAAYRAGALIVNERDGRTHDYRQRYGVEGDPFLIVPEDCKWAEDRSVLWNAAEAAENRKDAKVAREYTVALPAELDEDGRRELSKKFGLLIRDRYGVAVDVAVHEPSERGDERNFHAHLLTTTRTVGPAGLGAKTRQLDVSTRASVEVEQLRASWERLVNEALEQVGSTDRVSHLSHARRGTGLVPQVTLGVAASALERRGVPTEKGNRNREIAALNAELIEADAERDWLCASTRWAERRAAEAERHERAPMQASSVPAPSFAERRLASDQRMHMAREALGVGLTSPARSADVIARATAALEAKDRGMVADLASSVRVAWGNDGPIELRWDVYRNAEPVTRLRMQLADHRVEVATRREDTQRIQPVSVEELAGVAAQLSPGERADFLDLVGMAGQSSRAELERQRQEHDTAKCAAATVATEQRHELQRARVAATRPTDSLAGVRILSAAEVAALEQTKREKADERNAAEKAERQGQESAAQGRQQAVDAISVRPTPALGDAASRIAARQDVRRPSAVLPQVPTPEPQQLPRSVVQPPAATRAPSIASPDLSVGAPSASSPNKRASHGPEWKPEIQPTILEHLSLRGAEFVQWAAQWTRAVLAQDGPAREAIRAAWQHVSGREEVNWAVTSLAQWARTNMAEIRAWATGVPPVPMEEVSRAMREAALSRPVDDGLVKFTRPDGAAEGGSRTVEPVHAMIGRLIIDDHGKWGAAWIAALIRAEDGTSSVRREMRDQWAGAMPDQATRTTIEQASWGWLKRDAVNTRRWAATMETPDEVSRAQRAHEAAVRARRVDKSNSRTSALGLIGKGRTDRGPAR